MIVQNNYIFGRKYGSALLSNLVAYYAFENNANDSLGVHNGTAIGSPTYGAGKNGTAINFGNDITLRYIDIPDSDDFSFTNGSNDLPFTISMWVNFTSFSSIGNWLINKRGGVSNRDEWQFIRYQDEIQFYCLSLLNSAIIGIGFPFSTLNTWSHIVATYNGSQSVTGLKLYLNGNLQTTNNRSAGTYVRMPNGDNKVSIGHGSWGVDQQFKHRGLIDELAIWKNRELNATEVAELYNSGVGKFYPF